MIDGKHVEDEKDSLADSLGIDPVRLENGCGCDRRRRKFARAGTAVAKRSVMTARRTSCGGGSRNPGAAACGQVVKAFWPVGIAPAGTVASRSSGAGRRRRSKRCLVPSDD